MLCPKSALLTLVDWTKRGGIVGRGVLLDYCGWAERHNIKFDPMSPHPILISDLEAIAKEQNVEFKPGDILLVRSGWIKWYEEHSQEEREKYITNGVAWIGVKGCPETLEWLWNHHFSAVAGDAIGWEVCPWHPSYGEPPLVHCATYVFNAKPANSSARPFTVNVGNANWRDVGCGNSCRGVQEAE